MKQPSRSRALAFERMEDRLTLSATLGGDFNLPLGYLNADQGGLIDFRATLVQVAGSNSDQAVFNFDSSAYPGIQYYYDLLDGKSAGELNATDTEQIAPIPQPGTIGHPVGGMIELSNIFLPASSPSEATVSDRQIAQSSITTEASQISKFESPLREASLARGRDVYFEVASLSTKSLMRGRVVQQSSQDELVPLNHEVSTEFSQGVVPTAADKESVKAKPSSAAPSLEPKPKSATAPAPADSLDDHLRAAEKAASEPATKNALLPEQSVPKADDLSAVRARDEVFAEMWRKELQAEEVAVSLRTNENGKHYVAWPTLAVMVGGALVLRQRRMSRGNDSQFPPPRKKFGEPLRLE